MRIFFYLSLRNFLKSPELNILNILGLSFGVSAALLILVYVDHEFNFDQFHPESSSIYRLEGRTNGEQWFSYLGMEHARELRTGAYPQMSDQVMINSSRRSFFKSGSARLPIDGIIQTNPGSHFFDFFGFDVLAGDKQTMLSEPRSIVLTETVAQRFFGDKPPVGELLQYQDTIPYKVTGVIKDTPTHTHLQFNVLLVNGTLYQREHFNTNTYLRIPKSVDLKAFEQKILAMDVAFNQYFELSEVRLMPVSDIYLESTASFGDAGKGDPLQLRIFLVIGGLILLISITNYTNLSLAIFLGKGRAVGIRKVFGESKSKVFRGLAYESLLTTLLTVPIILILFSLVLPLLNHFLNVRLENKLISDPGYILGTLALLAIISMITVTFPALTLSRMDIGKLLKSKSAMNITGGDNYRNGLVFFQFLLLFTLGISGWFMNRQIQYLDNKDMGFDPTNVIKITNAYYIGEFSNYEVLKTKLLSYPFIEGVAFGPMMGDRMRPLTYSVEGSSETYENLLSYGVDKDYFDVMGMELTHGDFKKVLHAADAGQIVSLVNHSFIDRYGWSEDPINRKITLWPGSDNELNRKVSGVFGDFHFFTLKEKIAPQIISLRTDPRFVNTNILIKHNGTDLQQVIDLVAQEWYNIKPNLPLNYELMDDAVKALYEREKQTGRISIFFSILAIALSVLGMIGFMIYLINLKAKELTVRKVLGASLAQIVAVLNRQLWFFILVAGILGSLFSYFVVNHWLQNYAYAIEMDIKVFPVAIILVFALVLGITAFRSIKWARTNPAITLNEE